MKVVICGAGIAGLTLANRLLRAHHEPTIVEKSPGLRDDGYMIDFFGSGIDVAGKMGLLGDLEAIHHPIARLVFLDAKGREKFSVSYALFRRLLNNRHFNFMRGELERLLHATVKDHVEVRFGTTVQSFQQEGPKVHVSLSDGTQGEFDALVGADGVHSRVRALAFGEESRFLRFMGFYTAAFTLEDPPRGIGASDAFYSLTVPKRQVVVYPIRGGRLATFFLYRARQPLNDVSFETGVRELRSAFAGMSWVVPELLAHCGGASLYLDAVSQIEMPRWSLGRVVLIGDACQCVSLVAGQGASLAMAGAYLLARELTSAGGDVPAALERYESQLRPGIMRKQQAGRRLARWFLPDNRVRLAIRDTALRLGNWPVVSRLLTRTFAPESVIQV